MSRSCNKPGMAAAGPHDLRRTGRTALTSDRPGVSYAAAERAIAHLMRSALRRIHDRNEHLKDKWAPLDAWAAEKRPIVHSRLASRSKLGKVKSTSDFGLFSTYLMRAHVSISAHGFGHLAQVAPVVLALQRRLPDLDVIVRSGLQSAAIKRVLPDVAIEACDHDFGVPMRGIHCALEAEIFAAWQDQHARASQIQDQIAGRLQAEHIDFVISGVSPWPLAAAAGLGIPSFGIGSFSWSGILRRILRDGPTLKTVTDTLDAAYSKAHLLFSLTPGLGMDGLPAVSVPGTLVRKGVSRRSEIFQATGRTAQAQIVVFAFGGMTPVERPDDIAHGESLILLSPQRWAAEGFGIAADHLPIPFSDILASADVIVAKAGFGVASEIAANGTPAILVQRPDWPEDQPILDWLSHYSDCSIVSSLNDLTQSLLSRKLMAARHCAPPMDGAEEFIADRILREVLGKDFR